MPMVHYSCLWLLIAGLATAMVDIESHPASLYSHAMEKFLPAGRQDHDVDESTTGSKGSQYSP